MRNLILGWTSNLQTKILTGDYGFEVKDYGEKIKLQVKFLPQYQISFTEFSLLSSMLNIGAACVCILVGYIINLIGRRRTMLLIFVPLSIGWVLLIAATNAVMLIVGRAFIGVACGGVCVAGPVRNKKFDY